MPARPVTQWVMVSAALPLNWAGTGASARKARMTIDGALPEVTR